MNRLVGSRAGRWACALWGGFAGGVALGFLSAVMAFACGAAAIAIAVVAAAAASVRTEARRVDRTAQRPRSAAAILTLLVAFTFVAGAIRGASAVEAPNPHRIDGHLGTRPVAVVGTVRQTQPGGGGPVIIDVQRVADSDTDVAVRGGLLASGPNVPAVAPGDRVEVDASGLRAPNLRPGPESAGTLERENVEAIAVSPLVSVIAHGGPSLARGVAWTQDRLVSAVDAVLPEPQAALTLGIAFGIRQPIAAEVRQPLQDAGLIHIVVVSGLKVVLVISMVAVLARGLGWSPRRTLLVAAPVIAVYVVLSGAGPAAIRSALMAGAANVARLGGRRTDPLPMLALVAALMLGVDPPLLLDPGFQLSFLGTAGIVVMAEPLARRLPGPRFLAEPFAVTVAAQVATLPVMAGTFGVIALLGPAANALVLPLLPGLIVLGVLGASAAALVPAAGWALLQVGGLGATLTVAIARLVSAVPGAALQVSGWPTAWLAVEVSGLGAALATMWWLRSRHGRSITSARRDVIPRAGRQPIRRHAVVAAAAGLLAACPAGFAASRPDGLLHVTVLSTGGAPAVLVRGGDGSLALVDGGSSPSALLQALGRTLGPTDHRIALVVVSGGEQAAVAGLAGLPGHYDVGTVLASRDLNPGGTKVVAALQAAGAVAVDPAGRPWSWGGASWRCLPFRAQATDRAMCAVAIHGAGAGVLILGDAGSADQEEIAAEYGRGLTAELVVSAPGGSLAPSLLAAVRARAIAVPTLQGGYAAPAPPGYSVLRTGTQGDLRFDGGPEGLQLVG